MDKEIKRLLKLARIPNFRLSEKEQTLLDEWKSQQKPAIIKPKKNYSRKKKTTNEVKLSEKETGTIMINDSPNYISYSQES